MKISLVVMNPGKTAGHAIPITLSQFIIGRDPQCNLRPSSPIISKRHCAVLIKNGQVFLRDFDSTNGTFLNETQVKGEVPLEHDSIVKIGPLTFKVVIEVPVPVDKPTPLPATGTSGASAEDDVGNMMLSLQDGEVETSQQDSVPGGSTVMEMPVLPEPTNIGELPEHVPEAEVEAEPEPEPVAAAPTPRPPSAAPKPPEKKPAPPQGSARDAARAILDKYVKRNRGTSPPA